MLVSRNVATPRGAQPDFGRDVPSSGLRFARFAAVGGLGYVVNLACFAVLVGQADVGYIAAAVVSFAAAVANNYALNRGWTFADMRGPVRGQGIRFAGVSVAALATNLAVLHLLVAAGFAPLPAQAAAIVVAIPVNFLGNVAWTFRSGEEGLDPRLWLSRDRAAAVRDAVRASARARAWAAIGAWWLLSRAVVVVTAVVVQHAHWPQGRWSPSLAQHPLALLTAWDGRWYRMVAARGYLVVPGHQSDTAFFPLYPALRRVGRSLGLSPNAAGLLLSNVALLVGLVVLYELVRQWSDEATARRASVYAAIFPIGYVFSMVYPEALVLAAMALAGLLAARGRWNAAAVVAAVAALTRPEALFLVLPLGALAARTWAAADSRTRCRALTAVAAAPAAVAGICAYDWRTFGDPIAFSTAQRSWGRSFELDGPWRAITELAGSLGTSNAWLFRDAAFCVVYIALLVAAARIVPMSWVAAATLMIVLPLWSGSFTSDARFGVVAPPIYAGLALIGRRRAIDVPLRICSLALLVVATATVLLRWP
jgi:putative flippase GtrA